MAKLVLAAGVPHPPRLVREIADAGPGKLRPEALMKQVRQYVEKAAPDIIIEIDSDHFVNFFYDNVPAFCVGLAEADQVIETGSIISGHPATQPANNRPLLTPVSIGAKFGIWTKVQSLHPHCTELSTHVME